MERDTQTQNALALRLFSGEWAGGSSLDELQSAIQRTFEKLNVHLTGRLGAGGYHALLKRAVTLAAADFSWLSSVHVTGNGTLEGVDSVSEVQTTSEMAEGCIAILSRLIGLLETFIGRTLCLRVLQAVWPDAVVTDINSSQGESNG